MRKTPLITFTSTDDAGNLDYVIHCNALERWLSNGSAERGEDVQTRCRMLAAELREMADCIERGDGAAMVSVSDARARYAERAREASR